MASLAANHAPALKLEIVQQRDVREPVRFDSAFIERRMQEHRLWQEKEIQAACLEVVEEVDLAQLRAKETVERDIHRSPLFRSVRHRHAISPVLLGAKKVAAR